MEVGDNNGQAFDPAFERANPGDSLGSQQQRHPGAGRFVGSRAVEDDVAIPGKLSVAVFDLFHSYTLGSIRVKSLFLVCPDELLS